jgi:hypothetical protein
LTSLPADGGALQHESGNPVFQEIMLHQSSANRFNLKRLRSKA